MSLLAEEHGERYVNLVVSPYIAAYLKQGLISLRMRWALRFGMYISITASQGAGIVEVQYLDSKGENMLHPDYIGRRKKKAPAKSKKKEESKPAKASKEAVDSSEPKEPKQGSKSRRRGKKSNETKDKNE